jgi:hypothetical protein
MQINLHPYTIVGVAPRGFQGCKSGLRADAWIPLGMDSQNLGIESPQLSRCLLAPDTRQAQARSYTTPGRHRAESSDAAHRGALSEAHQGSNTISSDPLWRSPFGANVYLYGTLRFCWLWPRFYCSWPCANVANLLLVRSVARRREMAIRLSMEATRWRVMRQLLTENLVIALAGGGTALVLTIWTPDPSLLSCLPSRCRSQ